MCLSEPDNNRACLFDTDNVWQWQCLNHPALQIQIQIQWIQIQIQYNTYIFIYSYIRSDSFPNKKVILKRAPNFPEYFFPIFRSLCIFPNFWYFPNFQFLHNYFHKFFGVFFRMVRQDIFSNLPKFFFPNSGGVFLWILSIYPNFSEYFFPILFGVNFPKFLLALTTLQSDPKTELQNVQTVQTSWC